jgi:hypothetical protein
VDFTTEKQRSAGVSEVMPTYVGKPDVPKKGLEMPVDDVLRLKRSAVLRGEHESVVLQL